MFDTLGDKLNAALGPLRGRGKLDEEVISREIRLALLEADVNFKVVKDFVARVRERALGQDVLRSLTPGQQVVKIVHEELTELMGAGSSKLAFAGKPPTVILLAGLQGSGKTTAAAKLALLLRKEDHTPALVAADLQRPAAVDQLQQLGRQIQVPVFTGSDPVKAVSEGIQRAKDQGADVVILDTDARGGAALSVKAVTGKPIKLASVGEKLDQLEYFHPDRMASRILGMGDVLTLIERAEEAASDEDQAELEARMRAGEFTFDDFLASYRMLRKMGPLKGVLSMIPGLGNQLKDVDVNEGELSRVEAIVLSMTPQERRMPHLIDGSRRKRIAAGSGTTIQQVNKLLAARKQMQKMMKQMGKGKMPALPPELMNQRR